MNACSRLLVRTLARQFRGVLAALFCLVGLFAGCSEEPPLTEEGRQRLQEIEEREKQFAEEAARKLEAQKKRSPEEVLGEEPIVPKKEASKPAANIDAVPPPGSRTEVDSPEAKDETPPSGDAAKPVPAPTRAIPSSETPPSAATPTRKKPAKPIDPLNPVPLGPTPLDGDSVITLDDPPAAPRAPVKPPRNGGAPKDATRTDDLPEDPPKGASIGGKMPPAAAWRGLRGGMPAAEVEKRLGPPTSRSSDIYILYWFYGRGENAGKVAFIGQSQQAIAWDAPLE